MVKDVLSNDIKRLEKAFDKIERDKPHLKSVVTAFRELMISRVILKAKLPDRPDIRISQPNLSLLSEGHPWLTHEIIASFIDPWGELVESTMPPLARAFPGITADVLNLSDAFKTGKVDIQRCIGCLISEDEEEIVKTAGSLGCQPDIFKFILGQMLKPFVEKRTEGLRPLIEKLPWTKGYCPICGSFPEIGFLIGEDKQRRLKCSLCGYDWRFDGMACPYCGEAKERRELLSVADKEYEWVEPCKDCHRYILGIDLTKQKGMTAEVAIVGMVHLDIVARKRGFHQIAEYAWNSVPPGK